MQHVVYESQEQVPVHDLTVLIKGMIAQRLKLTTKGGVFGEECIIPERFSGLRTDLYVSCISFVMVVVISRETLFELVDNFPRAKKWLNRCSKRLTIRAAFRKAYAIYRNAHKHNTKSALVKRRNAPAAAPSKLRKVLARLKAARRHIDLELKATELGSCNDILAIREQSAFTKNGGAIFAEFMYQQRRSNPLPNQSIPNPPAPTRPRYKKNKASQGSSPLIHRQSVPADAEDTLRNAKELRHAMSTLELQQLSVENKVQTMLEMLTQVWGAG